MRPRRPRKRSGSAQLSRTPAPPRAVIPAQAGTMVLHTPASGILVPRLRGDDSRVNW
jgi:hypothetical protein